MISSLYGLLPVILGAITFTAAQVVFPDTFGPGSPAFYEIAVLCLVFVLGAWFYPRTTDLPNIPRSEIPDVDVFKIGLDCVAACAKEVRFLRYVLIGCLLGLAVQGVAALLGGSVHWISVCIAVLLAPLSLVRIRREQMAATRLSGNLLLMLDSLPEDLQAQAKTLLEGTIRDYQLHGYAGNARGEA